MVNSHSHELVFGIHEGAVGDWKRIVDTSLDSGVDIVKEQAAEVVESTSCAVAARSVVVLVQC